MKPGQLSVALLFWAGLSVQAIAVSVVGPGGIAAAPEQAAGKPVKSEEKKGNQEPVAKPCMSNGAEMAGAKSSETEGLAPAHVNPAVVKLVKFTVRDQENTAILDASVTVSKGTNGGPTSRLSLKGGIVTFDELPAVIQRVKVTAPGYKSCAGTADLRCGVTQFPVTLESRD